MDNMGCYLCILIMHNQIIIRKYRMLINCFIFFHLKSTLHAHQSSFVQSEIGYVTKLKVTVNGEMRTRVRKEKIKVVKTQNISNYTK